MGLADELTRLDELRVNGVLSDDEFRRAKSRLLNDPLDGDIPAVSALNRVRLSRNDRWLGGVCGGIAAITGIESWIWRLIGIALALLGGTGVLLYILLWVFVPED